jgi:hypothetical protein
MIEKGLVAFLKADVGTTALAGNRVFPLKVPQGVPFPVPPSDLVHGPCITYQRLSTERGMTLNGPTGKCRVIIRLDAWGRGDEGYIAAKNLAEAIRAATGGTQGHPIASQFAKLQGFKGVWGTGAGAFTVEKAVLDGDQDNFTPAQDGSDSGFFYITMMLTIDWVEF